MARPRQKSSGKWEIGLRHPSLPGGRKYFQFDTEAEAVAAAEAAAARDAAEQALWRMMSFFDPPLAEPGYECTYDVVLYSVFESAAALDAYQNHPQHVALKPFVAAVRSERQCMDYHVD